MPHLFLFRYLLMHGCHGLSQHYQLGLQFCVSDAFSRASRIGLFGAPILRPAASQNIPVQTSMTLLRCNERIPVPVLAVIPVHEARAPRHGPLGRCPRKRFAGTLRLYFKVLNIASEYGLSSLTDDAERRHHHPAFCRVASMVAPFIGCHYPKCSTN